MVYKALIELLLGAFEFHPLSCGEVFKKVSERFYGEFRVLGDSSAGGDYTIMGGGAGWGRGLRTRSTEAYMLRFGAS